MAVECAETNSFNLREGSALDYSFVWDRWLPNGASVASFELTIDPEVTVTASSLTGNSVTIRVTGITAGETGTVVCTITTDQADPQVDSRAITFTGVPAGY